MAQSLSLSLEQAATFEADIAKYLDFSASYSQLISPNQAYAHMSREEEREWFKQYFLLALADDPAPFVNHFASTVRDQEYLSDEVRDHIEHILLQDHKSNSSRRDRLTTYHALVNPLKDSSNIREANVSTYGEAIVLTLFKNQFIKYETLFWTYKLKLDTFKTLQLEEPHPKYLQRIIEQIETTNTIREQKSSQIKQNIQDFAEYLYQHQTEL